MARKNPQPTGTWDPEGFRNIVTASNTQRIPKLEWESGDKTVDTLGEGKQAIVCRSLVEPQGDEKSTSSIVFDDAQVLCLPEPFGSHRDKNMRLLREARGYAIARRQLIDPRVLPQNRRRYRTGLLYLLSSTILSRSERFWMISSARSHQLTCWM